MAFNGSGVFVRIMNWVQDKTNAINITASRMDTDSNDFAAAFNNCVTRDNQGKPSANFLASADASFDIGSSSVHWRDGWFSRNLSVGGTLSVTGVPTFTATAAFNGGLTTTTASFSGAATFTASAAFNGGLTGTTATLTGLATSAGVALGANDSSGRGIPICRFKTANTTRSSQTVPSNDPDLVYAIAATGTYDIELFVSLTGAISNTGLSANINYTGSMNSNSSYGYTSSLSGAQAVNAAVAIASAVSTATITISGLGNATISNYLWIKGTLIATGTGTLAFSWSQNTSSGNATQVNIGSFMKVTQVS